MAQESEQIIGQKTDTTKIVKVRAHERTIYLRRFKFICAFCDDAVTRETYSPVCPKYGNKCDSQASQCYRHGAKK